MWWNPPKKRTTTVPIYEWHIYYMYLFIYLKWCYLIKTFLATTVDMEIRYKNQPLGWIYLFIYLRKKPASSVGGNHRDPTLTQRPAKKKKKITACKFNQRIKNSSGITTTGYKRWPAELWIPQIFLAIMDPTLSPRSVSVESLNWLVFYKVCKKKKNRNV